VLGDEADIPPPSAISTMSLQSNDNSQLPSLSSIQPTVACVALPSILNEVWTLLADKYYLNHTFHGQDWNKVKTTYNAKIM